MGSMRGVAKVACVVALTAACPRRSRPPAIDAAQIGVVLLDAGAEVVGAPADVPRTITAREDVPRARRSPQRATALAWRRLPQIDLRSARTLGRWEDPPDFDEDGVPDPVVATIWSPASCRAQDPQRPCPLVRPQDNTGDPVAGPITVAFTAVFSGEMRPGPFDASTPPDGGTPDTGRLLGVRRLPVSQLVRPTVQLRGFEFTEFAVALTTRATLDVSDGIFGADVLDVVDLFAGTGFDIHVGTVTHHCAQRGTPAAPLRTGSIAVAAPEWTPVLWRAASAHPFSGCAVDTAAYDQELGAALLGGIRVEVIASTPAGPHRRVRVALDGEAVRVVPARDHADAGAASDPLTRGGLRVLDMARGCSHDRLRYVRDGRHCAMVIGRSDAPLPGCGGGPSPLDPAPPRAVALIERRDRDDAGVEEMRLVFARGPNLFSVDLPPVCKHGDRHHSAAPWTGPLPRGLEASADGSRVLIPHGDDLWLAGPGRRVPYLLNPPRGQLPRTDVRAAVFLDNDTVAAVFGGNLVRFSIHMPERPVEIAERSWIDSDEVRRGLNALHE